MPELTPVAFAALAAGLVVAVIAAGQPVIGLVLAVVAGIALDVATHDLVLVGVAEGLIVSVVLLAVLREKRSALPGESIRTKTPFDRYFAMIAIGSLVYLIIGIARNNELASALGDFCHLVFEISIPFFLVTIFLRDERRLSSFVRLLTIWMLILSVLIVVLYFTGVLQQLPGAGTFHFRTKMFRLRYTHHFPIFPLLLLLGMWLFDSKVKRPSGVEWQSRMLTGLSCLAMTFILVLSLKRTAWAAAMLIVLGYFALIGVKEKMNAIRSVVVAAMVLIALGAVFLPDRMFEEAEVYTSQIEGRFSSMGDSGDLSLRNRFVQVEDAIKVAIANPLGHGLGSAFRLRFSAHRIVEDTHYIHNGYVHYALQVGVGWVIVIIALSVGVLSYGLRVFRQLEPGPLKGLVLGSLGTYTGILVTAMTEVTFNTFFLPISAGFIGVIGRIVEKERAPLLAAAAAADDDDHEILDLPYK